MDQGLKERLIGAAVLAALAVWLVPWLLDGPDEPLLDDRPALELPVPSGHVGELRTEIIDLSPRRDASAAPSGGGRTAEPAPARPAEGGDGAAAATARPAAASLREEAASAPSAARAVPDADEGRAAQSTATEPPASTSAPARSATAAAPSGSASSASVSSPSTSSASTSSASAAPAARAETSESGGWAVQVGSFGQEENARRHADRVSMYGYSPKISTFRAGGRVMYRVRIGPHPTREAAEAAASALAAHGFVAQVVTN